MPSELSGGMRKRVALARAIISDEPIPKSQQKQLGNLFNRLESNEHKAEAKSQTTPSSVGVMDKNEKDEVGYYLLHLYCYSVTNGDDSVIQVIMYDEPTAGLDPIASTVSSCLGS